MITCRKPSLENAKDRRSICHATIHSRTPNDLMGSCNCMSCRFLSLSGLRTFVSDQCPRLSLLEANFQLPSNQVDIQLNCCIREPPLPSSSVASYHQAAQSTSHPSTKGRQTVARRA